MKEEWDGVDNWRGTWNGNGASFGLNFSSFVEHRDGPEAEVVAWVQPEGIKQSATLSQSLVKLLGPNVKRDLARSLSEKTRGNEYPWGDVIEIACQRSLACYRTGKAPVNLKEVAPMPQEWVIANFLPDRVTSSIFSDGASGKSMLMTACAIAVATGHKIGPFTPLICGPVLILNAETDEYEYAERVRRICAGHNTEVPDNLFHQEQMRPLVQSVRAIKSLVNDTNPVFSILDSAGALSHGSLNADEIANAMSQAIRQCFQEIPRVLVTHTSKANAGSESGIGSSIGSVYFKNYSRSQWEAKRDKESSKTDFNIGLYHRKSNRGPELPDISTRLQFSDPGGPIKISSTRVGDNLELAMFSGSSESRIRAFLRRGQVADTHDLLIATGISPSTFLRLKSRMPDLQVLEGGGGRNRRQQVRLLDLYHQTP